MNERSLLLSKVHKNGKAMQQRSIKLVVVVETLAWQCILLLWPATRNAFMCFMIDFPSPLCRQESLNGLSGLKTSTLASGMTDERLRNDDCLFV